jgi:hypothetical protein
LDDRSIVVYDLMNGETGKFARIFTDLFWCAVVDAGPSGGDDGVSRGLESDNSVFPAERSHPEAMNEDNSWF